MTPLFPFDYKLTFHYPGFFFSSMFNYVKGVMHGLAVFRVTKSILRVTTFVMMDIIVVMMHRLVRMMCKVAILIIIMISRINCLKHIVRRFFD